MNNIDLILKSNNIKYVTEYRFHPVRRWRFDFALPDRKIAIEYEGGTWNKGGHVRGKHYSSDCEKYSVASIMGWTVIRITADMLRDGTAHDLIRFAFENEDYNLKNKKA